MNDTRLWAVKDDLEATMRGIRDVTDGGRIKPLRDSDLAYAVMQHLMVAHRNIVELMHPDIPLCLSYSAVGSCCYRQAEHGGLHRSEWGTQWSDESDQRTGAAIAASMHGRRD